MTAVDSVMERLFCMTKPLSPTGLISSNLISFIFDCGGFLFFMSDMNLSTHFSSAGFYHDAVGIVSHPAAYAVFKRKAVYSGPEPDALNHASDCDSFSYHVPRRLCGMK